MSSLTLNKTLLVVNGLLLGAAIINDNLIMASLYAFCIFLNIDSIRSDGE